MARTPSDLWIMIAPQSGGVLLLSLVHTWPSNPLGNQVKEMVTLGFVQDLCSKEQRVFDDSGRTTGVMAKRGDTSVWDPLRLGANFWPISS